jgi:hypothetical protein
MPSSCMSEGDAQLQETCAARGDVLLHVSFVFLFGQAQGVLSSVAVRKMVEPLES